MISGEASTNPSGGIDTKLSASDGIGTPDHNLVGSVFAAGNTLGRTPTATGAALNYNINGHGVGITKEHVPGVRDSLTQQATVNLVNDGFHKLEANAFKSDNKLANGLKFEKNGGSLEYSNLNGHGVGIFKETIPGVSDNLTQKATLNLVNDGFHKLDANAFRSDIQQANGFQFQKTGGSLAYSNSNGHGASAGVTSIPNFGKTYELQGHANLWESRDRNSRFDLTGTASKTRGGPFDGQQNFGHGFGGRHFFK